MDRTTKEKNRNKKIISLFPIRLFGPIANVRIAFSFLLGFFFTKH